MLRRACAVECSLLIAILPNTLLKLQCCLLSFTSDKHHIIILGQLKLTLWCKIQPSGYPLPSVLRWPPLWYWGHTCTAVRNRDHLPKWFKLDIFTWIVKDHSHLYLICTNPMKQKPFIWVECSMSSFLFLLVASLWNKYLLSWNLL